jgi:hypothetical protein
MLLDGNMPEYWNEALSGLHPLFTGNAHLRIAGALAKSWGIPVPKAMAHYNTLPLERRLELDKIIEEAIAIAKAEMQTEILASDRMLTERLYDYELQLRTLLLPEPVGFVPGDPLLICALYDSLSLRSWGLRISEFFKFYRRLPVDQQQQIQNAVRHLFASRQIDNLTESLRALLAPVQAQRTTPLTAAGQTS